MPELYRTKHSRRVELVELVNMLRPRTFSLLTLHAKRSVSFAMAQLKRQERQNLNVSRDFVSLAS